MPTRQHKQWDDWVQDSAAAGIYARHWKKARPDGRLKAIPPEKGHRPGRCEMISTALSSACAMVLILCKRAARAKTPTTVSTAATLLNDFITQFCDDMMVELALDRAAVAAAFVVAERRTTTINHRQGR